ncbi:8-oxo-dGTP diphosphatase MutT [Aliikangiella maris]|uniref:8-oxo-dGTP diphosphatase n=2 Tax=Aliikangiella maris TaxID=3162458 RepID=A0ABV2BQ73_9GAMM
MSVVRVAAGIILKNQKVLIAQRPMSKHKGGYWEFPGGKIENQETPESALIRELKEELNIQVQQMSEYMQLNFQYPEKTVALSFFLVESFIGIPRGMENQPVQWVSIDKLVQLRFPEANLPVIKKLLVDHA